MKDRRRMINEKMKMEDARGRADRTNRRILSRQQV
jgi:hypothetical protein